MVDLLNELISKQRKALIVSISWLEKWYFVFKGEILERSDVTEFLFIYQEHNRNYKLRQRLIVKLLFHVERIWDSW